jgi:hypothetical protein
VIAQATTITNEVVGNSFSELTRGERYLIQRSRKNALKAKVPICHEWKYGNGVLSGAECLYRDLGKRPTASHRLARRNKKQEHSATNSYWASPGTHVTILADVADIRLEGGGKISLNRASELSGISQECIRARLRSITIEQAMLTPKSCRITYPKEDAIAFFSKINVSDCSAVIIQDEQDSHNERVGTRKPSQHRDFKALAVLSNNHLLGRITEVLNLDLLPTKKSSLLAFLACPTEIRNGTKHVLDGIIQRCRNENDKSFHHYGGRGIDVCESWVSGLGELSGFYCFVLDVGPKQPCMELDRIDNDAGYNKMNCRWVTRKENIRNTFRAEDIAARLNTLVEQAVRIELEAREEKIDMDDFLKSIL